MNRWLPIVDIKGDFDAATLWRWCEKGLVPAKKVKGMWYVDVITMLRRNDLDELADRCEASKKKYRKKKRKASKKSQ